MAPARGAAGAAAGAGRRGGARSSRHRSSTSVPARQLSQREDYYQTLGVPRDASDDAIKRAYKRQALRWHPDKHRGPEAEGASEQFKRVSEAYRVLSDPHARAAYDGPARARRDTTASEEEMHVIWTKTFGWPGASISFGWVGAGPSPPEPPSPPSPADEAVPAPAATGDQASDIWSSVFGQNSFFGNGLSSFGWGSTGPASASPASPAAGQREARRPSAPDLQSGSTSFVAEDSDDNTLLQQQGHTVFDLGDQGKGSPKPGAGHRFAEILHERNASAASASAHASANASPHVAEARDHSMPGPRRGKDGRPKAQSTASAAGKDAKMDLIWEEYSSGDLTEEELKELLRHNINVVGNARQRI